MPNWTENELTISGPDVQKVLNAIRSEAHEDEDACLLDFDKIIPYPKAWCRLLNYSPILIGPSRIR